MRRVDQPLRAITYARVSTDAQEKEGTSLETQEAACIQFIERAGWTLVGSYRDAASGASLERPGLDAIRQAVRRDAVDVIVAYAVDRLSRQQNHIGLLLDEVEQAQARLEFVTERFEDTAVGRFILSARTFVAEMEREKIRERTLRGKKATALAGRIPQGFGRGIFGYTYDPSSQRRLVNEAQAPVVQRLFEQFDAGRSLHLLAKQLNTEGVSTLSGAPWHPMTVRHILENPAYAGRHYFNRRAVTKVRHPKTGKLVRRVTFRPEEEWLVITDATPAIISSELFDRVQRRLTDPERVRRGRATRDYPLRGRARCLNCGKLLVGHTVNKRYHYYRCPSAFRKPEEGGCPSGYIRAVELEQSIRQEAARVLADDSLIRSEMQRRSAPDNQAEHIAALRKELGSLVGQRRRIGRLYEMGELSDHEVEARLSRIRRRIAEIEKDLADAKPLRPEPTPEELCAAREHIKRVIETAESDRLQLVMEALAIEVVAAPEQAEVRGTVPAVRTDEQTYRCL